MKLHQALSERGLWVYVAGWLLFMLGSALHLSAAAKPPSAVGVFNVLFGLSNLGFLVVLFHDGFLTVLSF
jgi:hypothetical protein